MSPVLILLLMFLCIIVLFFVLGAPVAFVLGTVGMLFLGILFGTGRLQILPHSVFNQMTDPILIAIPLFILIGSLLDKSGIADEMFEMIYKWLGPVRGGLAVGTVFICVIIAAIVGIVGAATVTMGLIALPAMLKRGYSKEIAIGCISGGGALGFLIPPSVTMIVYCSITGLSVGKMFLGGVMPGLLFAGLYIVYILVRSYFQPELCPPIPVDERATLKEKIQVLKGLFFPFLIIFSIMGTIFLGLATPTEAAAIGSLATLIVVAIQGKLTWKVFTSAIYRTASLGAMVLWIVIGCLAFSTVINFLALPAILTEMIRSIGLSPWTVLITMMISLFFMGMILDDLPIIMITTPIYVPIIQALGFDPLWYGILFILNMQMAYLTPPFGFVLFYMKGVVPPHISMGDIYRSVWPFVLLQALGLILVMLFPKIALWLPSLMPS
ncbi:MAG: TRAP transporter large permease subunit [Desulfosarcina sp.]|jgi:tripartite ATP-independent transporter DctM subunit